MTVKELIQELKQYDEDSAVWFYHTLIGKIMPGEIACMIGRTELTADGVLLKT